MKNIKIVLSLLVLLVISCQEKPKKKTIKVKVPEKKQVKKTESKDQKGIVLNDDNAIPFFYEYAAKNKENKVRIITQYGNIDILLYNNTPYHRANFIYLTKKKYFDGTMFHRVVPKFIIQGGNSDNRKSMLKRREIGRYLLPPDTKKGHSHHRGVISMPSSEIDNPHKLASPYEFFIIQQSPGAYYLDGNYTAFGEVISGMEVVDQINQLEVDGREMPISNTYIKTEIIR
ncbi:MAG: peptidylprolyl isomerase [Flavobacteriaceae bacterium]|nr:peptidylprolyl isomerase [Flavobacteriaceae bacterium]MDG1965856.1 peptidylprolyl isomerase [Flavobacteriaceae bacterium]